MLTETDGQLGKSEKAPFLTASERHPTVRKREKGGLLLATAPRNSSYAASHAHDSTHKLRLRR